MWQILTVRKHDTNEVSREKFDRWEECRRKCTKLNAYMADDDILIYVPWNPVGYIAGPKARNRVTGQERKAG